MRILLFTLAFASMASSLFAQTDATRALQEKHADHSSLYFYQSTLRALNTENNKELDQLIRGIEKIAFVQISNDSLPLDGSDFDAFVSELSDDGYKELMGMSSPENRFAWYTEEEEGSESFVAIMEEFSELYVLDLQGSVDINMLYSLQAADLGVLSDILKKQGIGQ